MHLVRRITSKSICILFRLARKKASIAIAHSIGNLRTDQPDAKLHCSECFILYSIKHPHMCCNARGKTVSHGMLDSAWGYCATGGKKSRDKNITGGEAKGWLVRGKAPTDLEEATAAAEVRVEEVHILAGGLRERARGVERLGAAGSRQQPGKSGGIRDQTRVGSNDKEG